MEAVWVKLPTFTTGSDLIDLQPLGSVKARYKKTKGKSYTLIEI